RQSLDHFVKELDAVDVSLFADAFVVAVITSAEFARRGHERREAVAHHAQVTEIVAVGEAGQYRIGDDRFRVTLFADRGYGLDQFGVGWRGVGLERKDRLDLDRVVFDHAAQLGDPAVQFFARREPRVDLGVSGGRDDVDLAASLQD